MKCSFKFTNVLGAIYRKGHLVFTPDGNSVISPIGNRIAIYDLKSNTCETLPVESKFNYEALELSPSGTALVAVNEEGEAHIISMICRRKIITYRFNEKIRCIKFSPDGKYIAFSKINKVFVFLAPGYDDGNNVFVMEKVFSDSLDETTWIDWADDSRIFAVGSKDGVTRIYSMEFLNKFRKCILASHSDFITAVFFESNSLHINTISRNGQLCIWECNMALSDLKAVSPPQYKKARTMDDAEEELDDVDYTTGEEREKNMENEKEETTDDSKEKIGYKRLAKHYLNDLNKEHKCSLLTASYHKKTKILATGFSNGAFFIHELPDVNLIHSLSISEFAITSMIFNGIGDWIAIGCAGKGQLLVWEWQSETYILRQQSHSGGMSCLAYSHDGLYIITGGEDGKIKVWNTQTGFCFVTFSEHTAAVTAVQMGNAKKCLISSSLDGTVRAYDMTRYRNFRTFTSPRPVQFSCVAIDSTSEFIAAGAQDSFDIYLWSMKLGRLLECLTGHEAPLVSLSFSPIASSSKLVSVSWDKTLQIWDTVNTGTQNQTVSLSSEGLFVCFKPDGKEVAVSTLDGNLSFFDCMSTEQLYSIEGRNDLGSGRAETDMITAKKNLQAKAFTNICYSPDGECIIAGGQSKNVCVYNVSQGILMKKFEITQNRSLDAVDDFVNHRKLTEFGNIDLIEERNTTEGLVKVPLPGVKRGDMASRSVKPEVRVFSIAFSPTGLSWSAATTEGVLYYTLDGNYLFDPFQLMTDITPDTIKKELSEKQYSKALMMSLRLNESDMIRNVIESIQPFDVELVVRSLPHIYLEKTLKYLSISMSETKHVEFYIIWITHLLNNCKEKNPHSTILMTLQRNLGIIHKDLSKVCNFNKFTMQFYKRMFDHKLRSKKNKELENEENESVDVVIEDDFENEINEKLQTMEVDVN